MCHKQILVVIFLYIINFFLAIFSMLVYTNGKSLLTICKFLKLYKNNFNKLN